MGLERYLGVLMLLSAVAHQLSAASLKCVNDTKFNEPYLLCVGRPHSVQVGQNTSFQISMVEKFSGKEADLNVSVSLNVSVEHSSLATLDQSEFELSVGSNWTLTLHSLAAGRSDIQFNCTAPNTSTCPFSDDYLSHVRSQVAFSHSHPLDIIIAIVGWIYFAAWSISFYPQIILNFYRRSVIGLNFDFLALNITGFLAYCAFNVGLYWTKVENEYFIKNPGSVNPVQLNDVVFSMHAVAATTFTIFQCFIFKRGGQRVSYTAVALLVVFWLVLLIPLFVSVGGKLSWLVYLNVASYVKLAITLIKYIPQVWLNFKRKSTVGWSIGNVLLDFTGGFFSILQMFLLSYNYDDWGSIFGDPTKFGLGVLSILFDIVFMLQHYVCFRHPQKEGRGYQKIADSAPHNEDEAFSTPPPSYGSEREEKTAPSDEKHPLIGVHESKSNLRRLIDFLK